MLRRKQDRQDYLDCDEEVRKEKVESKNEKTDKLTSNLLTFPFSDIPTSSRHHREGEIIPIAARVTGLEIVAVDRDNPAIGQVAEGAADWVRARVADEREPKALFQAALGLADQV